MAESFGFEEIVSGKEDGDAFGLGQANKVFAKGGGGDGVEAGGGFVKEDQSGTMEEGSGDGEFLFHAAAPGADAFAATVPQIDFFEQFLDSFAAVVGGHVPNTGVELEVFFGAQAFVEPIVFEQGTGVLPNGMSVGAGIEA